MKTRNCSWTAVPQTLYFEVACLKEQFLEVKRESAFKLRTLMKIEERQKWLRSLEEEAMQDNLCYGNLHKMVLNCIVT